jgi:hypothetical protein
MTSKYTKPHETSMTTPRLTCGFPAFVACFLLAAHVTADEPKPNPAADKAAFEKAAAGAAWAVVFYDYWTPTFPGPSASRKPGLRKQFTSS